MCSFLGFLPAILHSLKGQKWFDSSSGTKGRRNILLDTRRGIVFCGMLTTLIFTMENRVHLFRCFLTSAGEPHFDNGIKATSEKLHVICDMFVVKILLGLSCVIQFDLVLVVIAKFKIGTVKQLIFLYVAK